MSPSIAYGNDLPFYEERKEELLAKSASQIIKEYFMIPSLERGMKAAPLFPLLIYLADYRDANPLPMAVLFFCLSTTWIVVWLKWLIAQNVPFWMLVLVALLPHPIYYMICISTDLLFALLFAVFFVHYFKRSWQTSNIVVWSVCLLLMLLTRPNGVAVMLFVCADIVMRKHDQRQLFLPFNDN